MGVIIFECDFIKEGVGFESAVPLLLEFFHVNLVGLIVKQAVKLDNGL